MANKLTPDRIINPVTIIAWDGEDFWAVKCSDEGHLLIDVEATVIAEGLALEATLLTKASEAKLELVRLLLVSLDGKDFATQTTLALVATEAKLELCRQLLFAIEGDTAPIQTDIASLEGKDFATQTTLAVLAGKDFATQTTLALLATENTLGNLYIKLNAVLVELQAKADLDETQPISAAALPLPSGAATQTTLALLGTEVTLGEVESWLDAICTSNAAINGQMVSLITELEKKADLIETQPVSGAFYPGTQPVSGAFYPGTQPVSAASLPLPSGAATSSRQDTIISELQKKYIGKPIDATCIAYSSTMGGTNALKTAWTVPGGQYWVLTSMSAKNSSGALTELTLIVNDGSHAAVIGGRGASPQYDHAVFNGNIYLLPGWQLQAWFRGGSSANIIEIQATVHRIG